MEQMGTEVLDGNFVLLTIITDMYLCHEVVIPTSTFILGTSIPREDD